MSRVPLTSPPLPPLGYGALRRRWCARALAAWLKRWALYLLVLAVLFGAGSNSLVGSVGALAGWTVVPLLWAVAQAPAWLPAVVATQVLLAAGLVWGMRSLLWPVAWRAAERALPINPRAQRQSDMAVVALGLLPLLALYWAGLLAWWLQRPGWLAAAWPWACLALALVSGASLAAGVVVMQVLRRPLNWSPAGRPFESEGAIAGMGRTPDSRRIQPKGTVRVRSPARSLVLLPLLRGPARRTAFTGLLGLLALLAMAIGLCTLPAHVGWWLAAWAGGALVLSSRLRTLIDLELTPLATAAAALPVAPCHWRRLHAALALSPMALSLPVVLLALPWPRARPAMVLAYALVCGVVCVLEVAGRAGPPADKAARWLVSLVLVLALASEVVA